MFHFGICLALLFQAFWFKGGEGFIFRVLGGFCVDVITCFVVFLGLFSKAPFEKNFKKKKHTHNFFRNSLLWKGPLKKQTKKQKQQKTP